MEDAAKKARFLEHLGALSDLRDFVMAVHAKLPREGLVDGEEISERLTAAGIVIPECLEGSPITYLGGQHPPHGEQALVMKTAPHPHATTDPEDKVCLHIWWGIRVCAACVKDGQRWTCSLTVERDY